MRRPRCFCRWDIASPIEPPPDGLLFFGQIVDHIIVRAAYALPQPLVVPAVLEDSRSRADARLMLQKGDGMRFGIAFSAVRTFLFTILSRSLLRR